MALARLRRQWGAWCVGLVLTLAVAVLHGFNAFQRIEWHFLDVWFRHLNRVDAGRQIVHIDIDDAALERVGAWPWPRDLQAELIRTLRELDARSIVLDLVFSEPRPPELRLPQFTPFATIEGHVEQIGEVSAENTVYPDDELAAAIRDAGNVYLATFYKPESPASPVEAKIVDALAADIEMSAETLAQRLGLSAERAKHFPLARLRRQAIEQRVNEYIETHPLADVREVHRALRPAPFETRDAVREDVLWAYARVRSLRAMTERCPPLPSGLAGRVPSVRDVTPPLFPFVAGARAAGFVFFEPDPDGKLRHLPLAVEYRGRLLKQLAFAVLCDEAGIRDEDLAIDERGRLTVAARGDRPAMRVQLDDQRRMLLNWHRGRPNWAHSFTHVPAAELLEVCDLRQRQRENERARQTWLARAIRLAKDDTAFAGYRREVERHLADRRQLHWAELQGRTAAADVAALRARVEEQRRRIEADQAATVELIRETWQELKGADPSDASIAGDYRRFQEAHEILDGVCRQAQATNADLERRLEAQVAALKPLIAGKTCFVGYTATAVADMVDTPVFARMPGVIVHSNLYNTFAQRAFYRWSGPWERAAVVAIVGVLVTALSASRGPRASFALVVLTMVTLAAINLIALGGALRYWLAAVVGVALAFVAWALVEMFRFLVSEREKRRFSKALSQYTSPAIARQIAEDVGRLDLSPVAGEVTCFFSDLASFTTLCEQYLDPARTRSVLNPYLDAMSRVLNEHAALINKFMGDGIFAFFNPPIYPCAEHARRACEAAIESQRALAALIERQRGTPLGHVFERLSMRIGLATGPVYVGDYGSENKLDYTCMGDTVNLAARLEPANKAFGTSILVSGPTRDAAGDGLVFRRLGSLQVKGKQIAVPVYELLGRRGDVTAEAIEYAERFSAAVDLFQSRRWNEAEAAFRDLLVVRAVDIAARRYADLVTAWKTTGPPADWNGAIELTEK